MDKEKKENRRRLAESSGRVCDSPSGVARDRRTQTKQKIGGTK